MRRLSILLALLLVAAPAMAQSRAVCKPCIQAHEEFLASDALRGRGSATDDEQKAAEYIAGELKKYGVQPFEGGDYIQPVVTEVDLSKLPMDKIPPAFARRLKAAVHEGKLTTRNVLGILPGSDRRRKGEVVLLSAHLDHLGTAPEEAVAGDDIFNGADDDASGVTAVLELARALASGRRPRRTVVFAFFGSEELGGFGNRYFLQHPPVPLASIVANLEFEMIGRPDAAVAAHTLWLTGWKRSNLGPVLAKHGARLVGDPHPKEHFFQRSDNYALARKGIVAQTVSSFGLHTDYHQPSDDLAHLDLAHMAEAIGSMIRPVRWLANSSFKPRWKPGGKPQEASAQPAARH
ncbi:MAG TPA: M20/M25/M40 family metallo-hydrolase [Terriglobales bacterium]|nr:M20/M25/M40 family metallo-hydrolase [Terriglobales bacterium]